MSLLILAAEAANVLDASTLAPTLSSICSVGFAVWHSWYMTTKTIPDQQKEHREHVKSLVEEFRQESKELRETYGRWIRPEHT